MPGVIFTRNAISTGSTDETGGQCNGVTGNKLGFPISKDITKYSCTAGDIFVSGVVKGRVTVAAENDVVIVDDITYKDGVTTQNDMLGLIAEQIPRSTRRSWP